MATEITEARELLEDAVREQVGKAYRYGLVSMEASGDRGAPLGYPEEADAVAAVVVAASGCGPLLKPAEDAIAFERERAGKAEAARDAAQAELDALADRIGTAVRAAVEAERERILCDAFACRDCGKVHERVPAAVTSTWKGGYVTSASDGHAFRPRLGEGWRELITGLVYGVPAEPGSCREHGEAPDE